MPLPNYMQADNRAEMDSCSNLPDVRKNSIVLYGIFSEICRNFYTEEFSEGGVYPVWNKSLEATDIWIDQEQVWTDKAPDFRPAIYVQMDPIKFSSDTGKTNSSMGVNLKDGEYEYQIRSKGIVTWAHVGSTSTEALKLASRTQDLITAFSDPLRKEFCFDKFYVIQFNPC
jgi:hypothetical protein